MQPITSIGIFDSGIGGLTVYKEIRSLFPTLDIIYLGDTARVPYGSKSKKTIIDYSINNCNFLIKKNVSIIIVACNTSSAVALDSLRANFHIPIFGVVSAAVKEAIKKSCNGKIGIIGTQATIDSGIYSKKIKSFVGKHSVYSVSTPLLVPIVESSYENHIITKIVLAEYLKPLLEKSIDTLILGCTHYPLLIDVINDITENKLNLINCAKPLAKYLKEKIPVYNSNEKKKNKIYVTDNHLSFLSLAKNILNNQNLIVKKTNI